MQNEQISALIEAHLADSQVLINGDGYHYEITVIADKFHELTTLQRQKTVYQALQEAIVTGQLHAVSIKALTPEEWEQQHG